MPDVDFQEDITKPSFKDNSFNFICCSNVLEHISDDVAAMSELYRILVPGGVAIIQFPIRFGMTIEDPSITDPEKRTELYGQGDHVRFYGEDIKDRLTPVGFEVEPFYMLDVLDLSESGIEKMNLNKRELIHKCMK